MELDLKELDSRVQATMADLEALLAAGQGRLVWHDEAFAVQGLERLEPEVEGLLTALNELAYPLLRHRQEVHAVVPQPSDDGDPAQVRIPQPFARSRVRNWCIYRADYMAERAAESLEAGGVAALVRPAYIFPAVVSSGLLDRIFRIRDRLGETADGRAAEDWLVADARGRDEA